MRYYLVVLALCAMALMGCSGDTPFSPDLSVTPSMAAVGDTVQVTWDAHGGEILSANFPATGNAGSVAVTVPDTSVNNDPGRYTYYLRVRSGNRTMLATAAITVLLE